VPGVNPPLALTEWLMQGSPETVRIVLDPLAERALTDWEQVSRVTLVVGPEGGFSEVEVALLGRSGADAYSLGPRVLRTETAAPAAVAVLQSLAGDFR
jgi:16S rRNA (uracil1498-N3)-methyltransferase